MNHDPKIVCNLSGETGNNTIWHPVISTEPNCSKETTMSNSNDGIATRTPAEMLFDSMPVMTEEQIKKILKDHPLKRGTRKIQIDRRYYTQTHTAEIDIFEQVAHFYSTGVEFFSDCSIEKAIRVPTVIVGFETIGTDGEWHYCKADSVECLACQIAQVKDLMMKQFGEKYSHLAVRLVVRSKDYLIVSNKMVA